MKTYKEIGKWVLFVTLGIVAALAFMVLAGESDEMSLGQFIVWKLAAAAVMYLCYLVGKRMYDAGLLPERVMKDLDEEDWYE